MLASLTSHFFSFVSLQILLLIFLFHDLTFLLFFLALYHLFPFVLLFVMLILLLNLFFV